MTLDETITMCRDAIAACERLGCEPGVQLILPGERRGRRAKLMPGVWAEVLATEDGPTGPRTIVRADPRVILRELGVEP